MSVTYPTYAIGRVGLWPMRNEGEVFSLRNYPHRIAAVSGDDGWVLKLYERDSFLIDIPFSDRVKDILARIDPRDDVLADGMLIRAAPYDPGSAVLRATLRHRKPFMALFWFSDTCIDGEVLGE